MQESQLNTYSLLIGEYAIIAPLLRCNYTVSINSVEIPGLNTLPYSIVPRDVVSSSGRFEMYVDVSDVNGEHSIDGNRGIVNFTTNWKSDTVALRDLSEFETFRANLNVMVDVNGKDWFDYILINHRLARFPYEVGVFTSSCEWVPLCNVIRIGADYYARGVIQPELHMRVTDIIVAEAFIRSVLDCQLPGIAHTYNSVRAITYSEGDFVTQLGEREIGVVCSATPVAPLTYADKVNVFFPKSRTVLSFYGFELEPVQQ